MSAHDVRAYRRAAAQLGAALAKVVAAERAVCSATKDLDKAEATALRTFALLDIRERLQVAGVSAPSRLPLSRR